MNLDKYRKDIDSLVELGWQLYRALAYSVAPAVASKKMALSEEKRKELPEFRSSYQTWYSESLAAIRQLLPDRVDDFVAYYKPARLRKVIDNANYTVSDFLQGITVARHGETIVGFDAAFMPFQQQVQIVEALKKRFKSSLFDIRSVAQADLFDTELDAADELNRNGFLRGAGAIAGVVLEGHLSTICEQHKIAGSSNKTISPLNDLLKKNDVIDVPTWRLIQHLGDLRNLCDHKKDVEPTKEQMTDLIAGVRKIIKTVF